MVKASRGSRTDGEATRARILEAAGLLYAKGGFADTTSKAIAERAKVDLASINYHFGSRDGLYQAVLVEAHSRLMDFQALQQLAQSPQPAPLKLKALLALLVSKAMAPTEDWHLTVLATEVLGPSAHLSTLFETEIPKKIAVVAGIVSEITHIPLKDPALLRCMLSVAAPCLLLLIGRRGIPGPVQAVRAMPMEHIIEHLYVFSMAGLEAAGSAFKASAEHTSN